MARSMINPATRSTSLRPITKASSHEIELFEPPPDAVYTIEATSYLVDVPRHTIMVYCKHRLLSPVISARDTGYSFDREGIRALRRIQALRTICGDDLAGIRIILELTTALEQLRSEVRSLSRKSPTDPVNNQARSNPTSSRKTKTKFNPRRTKK